MPAQAIDSVIFKDMYGTDELRRVFSDENLLQCWLDAEAALARAQDLSNQADSMMKGRDPDMVRIRALLQEAMDLVAHAMEKTGSAG